MISKVGIDGAEFEAMIKAGNARNEALTRPNPDRPAVDSNIIQPKRNANKGANTSLRLRGRYIIFGGCGTEIGKYTWLTLNFRCGRLLAEQGNAIYTLTTNTTADEERLTEKLDFTLGVLDKLLIYNYFIFIFAKQMGDRLSSKITDQQVLQAFAVLAFFSEAFKNIQGIKR